MSLVDQHIIIFGPVADLARGAAACGSAMTSSLSVPRVAQAALELGHRRRQDEDADEVLAHRRMKLLRALPVDVEQDVAAGLRARP